DYLDQMEFADKLGFDGVCLNEHHQTAYGMMPIPGVLAGALARGVKRAKLAILGRALPLLNNPLMVAEEYAILDNLTRGRLIAGFVRGIGAEYHAIGINPAYSQERFAEAHLSGRRRRNGGEGDAAASRSDTELVPEHADRDAAAAGLYGSRVHEASACGEGHWQTAVDRGCHQGRRRDRGKPQHGARKA